MKIKLIRQALKKGRTMKIEDYSFGHIVIDGKEYTSDVLIFPDGRVDSSWWRDEGHVLKLSDMADLVSAQPEMIIAGTGASGMMTPESDVASMLRQKGIEFNSAPTKDAVGVFNKESQNRKVAACLHLTC